MLIILGAEHLILAIQKSILHHVIGPSGPIIKLICEAN